LAGNDTHPENDPLWNTPLLQELVSRRLPKSDEERAEIIRQRNREAYRKGKETEPETKAKVQGFVEAGRMTQKEADSVILSGLHGQYRVKYQKEMADRKAEMSLKELEVTNKMKEAFRHLQASAQQSTYTLTSIFNCDADATKINHLQRNGFDWPTEPSILAFYLLYAAGVPIGSWPPDGANAPDVKVAFHAVTLFLHPDKALRYHVAFGGDEKIKEISATLMASKCELENYLASPGDSADEKRQFLNQNWETAKYKILKAMRPNSDTIPPFFISYLIDEAASKLPKANDPQPSQ
jgi:hypothetical protein